MENAGAVTLSPTHPWLVFERTDLRRASFRFWMLLGEAVSKCFHIARVPLRPATADRLHRVFMAKGVHGTTAIEGNTLSEQEVLRSLEDKLELPPSKDYLGREIDNVVRVCNAVDREIAEGGAPPLSVKRLSWFNASVLEGLELEEGVVPGVLRSHVVSVGGYVAPPAGECEPLLRKMCDWLSEPILPEDFPHREVSDAIIRAMLAHLYVAWIHPFGDGNGRTARLIEVQILLDGGLPTPSCHLLSNHYNKTRTEYYRQLDKARRDPDGVCEFLEYALQGFVDGQADAIEQIWYQQLDVTWRSHVYQQLKSIRGGVGERIQVLGFGFHSLDPEWIALEDVPDLTPKIARTYAKLSERTLRRDLAELVERGVLTEENGRYQTNLATIVSWLPRSKIVWDLVEQSVGAESN